MGKRRDEDIKRYNKISEEKKNFQIKNNIYRCFFCNTPLKDEQNVDRHHVLGRNGELLYQWDNIFFAHRSCHTMYHGKNINQLYFHTRWYKKFLKRLEKWHCKGYNKELKRLQKGGIIDMEQYLELIKECQ